MGTSIDAELTQLIAKLTRIQEEVGTIDGDKRKQKRGAHGVDRFSDLKNQMMDKLADLKESMEQAQRLEKQPGENPRELIAVQAKIRGDLAIIDEDWKELEGLHRAEAMKRRSKLSQEELAARQKALVDLQTEIKAIKEFSRFGNTRGFKRAPIVSMAESEMFKKSEEDSSLPRPRGVQGKYNNEMTDQHRLQLKQIKDRDAAIDDEIEKLGEGIDELGAIARAQNEEVKLHNTLLTSLEEKVDEVHDKVFNVNQRLKNTLEEVRSSDKICFDVICILILIGMIIVLVKVST